MDHFNTVLTKSIVKGEDIKEAFRRQLENALNQLLKYELTVFLDYEPYDPIGYNSGNSRNGYYQRQLLKTPMEHHRSPRPNGRVRTAAYTLLQTNGKRLGNRGCSALQERDHDQGSC